MIQLETQNTQCLQTPPASWFDGPDSISPPSAPRGRVRVQPEGLSCLIMDNLDNLAAPGLGGGAGGAMLSFRPPMSSSSPMFNTALERMRNGGGLQKLIDQRDEQRKVVEVERRRATGRLRELGISDHNKNLPDSQRLALGRQAPPRSNSGIARSA